MMRMGMRMRQIMGLFQRIIFLPSHGDDDAITAIIIAHDLVCI